ncbi:MAG: cobalamin-dependent protein [Anaerolineae bacterium]|nr:cobalamin-dependent protein [Anaerolineae bacterium]
MKNGNGQTELIRAIADLEEDVALDLVRHSLADGVAPLHLVEACQEGLRQVGERYESQEYYLAGLIMGGEIFRQVMDLIGPVVTAHASLDISGHIVLGTVQGDIHDLGKMILEMLLNCNGFTVHDLGVDVSADTFVARVQEMAPDVVGLSGLLTSSYDTMRDTVARLRAGGYAGPIVIGGGQLSEEVCQYVGADYWTTDAVAGVTLCRRLVEEAHRDQTAPVAE